jgi:amidohydrolase
MSRTSRRVLAGAFVSMLFGVAMVSPRSRSVPPRAPGSSKEQVIARAAEELKPQLVAWRRDFHMHPELSNREERTSGVIAERLRAMGFDEVKTGVGKHGIVALLRGANPGPVVATRADMDALPIQETIDVPYKSQNPGVKHACGHDVHMTVALGVAEILSRHRKLVNGTVKFMFQPAEEGPPEGEEGGAKLMIEQGALENPRPQAIFGLHTSPALEVGQIGIRSGAAMAASDSFTITIRGRKVHGAQPHLGVDAVVVAAECVTALQTIRSRRMDATQPFVISVGIIHGGNRFNIIADEVKLEGTIRTLDEDVRQRIPVLMRQILDGITAAHGASYDFNHERRTAITFNDPQLVDATLPAMKRVLGEANVQSLPPFMASEDFSYYQQVVPGIFYFLGVGNKSKGITAGWHTPEFDVDEESLAVGVKVMANVLLDHLDRQASDRTPRAVQ